MIHEKRVVGYAGRKPALTMHHQDHVAAEFLRGIFSLIRPAEPTIFSFLSKANFFFSRLLNPSFSTTCILE